MDFFSSMSSFFNQLTDFPWSDETDDRTRACKLSLYSRALDNSGLAEHWALFFDWSNKSATYEAYDDDGFLMPSWNNGLPETVYTWKVVKSFTIRCSPKKVNTEAKNLSINGSVYILTRMNCHKWAIELANKFGVTLDQSLEMSLPTDMCNIIDVGYAISNLTGAFKDAMPASLANPEVGSQRFSADQRTRTTALTSSRALPSASKACLAGTMSSRAIQASRGTSASAAGQLEVAQQSNTMLDLFKIGAGVAMLALSAYKNTNSNHRSTPH